MLIGEAEKIYLIASIRAIKSRQCFNHCRVKIFFFTLSSFLGSIDELYPYYLVKNTLHGL